VSNLPPSGDGNTPEPIFVSVKQAAQMLGISPWTCYQLLDSDKIDSRYHGRRRLVSVESLRQYAKGLPKYPEVAS
jgi:excisionase family DNA binding protein